jgi:uncharacterized protein (TIGR02246 family)
MHSLFAIAWILMVPVTGGGDLTPLPAPTGAEKEVHALHRQFAETWNRHDVAALAALWTEDGDYTEPDGRTVFGREAIQRLYGYEHASVFKESRLNLFVERVRFISDGLALSDGSYELFDARDPKGNPIGTRAGYFTTVLIKKDGNWKVSASRLMLPQVLIWREKP